MPFQINHFQNFVYSRVNIVNLAQKHFSKNSRTVSSIWSRSITCLAVAIVMPLLVFILPDLWFQIAYYELEDGALAGAVLAHQSDLHPFAQRKSASFKIG